MRGWLAALLALWSLQAMAHVTSTGLAVVDLNDHELSYRLTVVASEIDELYAPILQSAANGDRNAAERVAQAMRNYARFAIGGADCAPGRIAMRGSNTGDGKVVLDMSLVCPKSSGMLMIRDDWPEVMGGHFQTVMSVRVAGRPLIEIAFLEDRRSASVEIAGARSTGWLDFIVMGARHILSGPDHLLFLLALLALSRSLWTTVKIVTGFTAAHSITLSLAALGLVDVPSRIVEPLIAASIVWVALENLLAPSGIGRRWLVAAAFGLVHGLGFAGGLLELGLPREALVRALVGFNVGVELGQIAFVAIVLPPLAWASRPGRWTRLPQLLSIAVAAMGAIWLVERVFFSP
jgi:hydrogenase/urease accessory protein HupE